MLEPSQASVDWLVELSSAGSDGAFDEAFPLL